MSLYRIFFKAKRRRPGKIAKRLRMLEALIQYRMARRAKRIAEIEAILREYEGTDVARRQHNRVSHERAFRPR